MILFCSGCHGLGVVPDFPDSFEAVSPCEDCDGAGHFDTETQKPVEGRCSGWAPGCAVCNVPAPADPDVPLFEITVL